MEISIRETIEAILTETDVGQRALAENRSFLLEKRKELLQEIDALRRRQEEELPPLQLAAEEAREACQQARAELRKVEQLASEKVYAASGRSLELTGAIERLQSELRATADPAIQRLIDELQSRLEFNRHTLLKVETHRHPRNIFTDKQKRTVVTNAQSIETWMAAMRQTIKDLEAMKLEASEDLPGRLKVIRENVAENDKLLKEPPCVTTT